jgi:hypothetical protein
LQHSGTDRPDVERAQRRSRARPLRLPPPRRGQSPARLRPRPTTAP